MSDYVVQAGIGDQMYYRRTMPHAERGAQRRSAFDDKWHLTEGKPFPNESVTTRAGKWSADRLFHPTWLRILKDERLKGSILPEPRYESIWQYGNCPTVLLPPLVRGLPTDRPRTTLVDTVLQASSSHRDKMIQRRLLSKARRDARNARLLYQQMKQQTRDGDSK